MIKYQKITPCLLASLMLLSACAKQSTFSTGSAQQELDFCSKILAKKDLEEAIDCFENLKVRHPRSSFAQDAELKIADAYFLQKEYLLAAESYRVFIKIYPRSKRNDYAHYRAGLAYFKESPKAVDRDQGELQNAIKHFKIVLHRYPQSQFRTLANRFLRESRNRIAQRHFYIGRFYYRTKEYIAASNRLKELVDNYADSGLAPKSFYLMIKANIKLDRIEAAKENFSDLSIKYPKSPWTEKARKKLLTAAKKALKKNNKE